MDSAILAISVNSSRSCKENHPVNFEKGFRKRPHTIFYPKESNEAADSYRGFHYNELSECIGCGNCSAIYQNEAIEKIDLAGIEGKKDDTGLRPRVDNGRCCWCALCVEVCPTGSLYLTKDYLCVSEYPDSFLWTPGVDNPDGKNRISNFSTKESLLNLFQRVPVVVKMYVLCQRGVNQLPFVG